MHAETSRKAGTLLPSWTCSSCLSKEVTPCSFALKFHNLKLQGRRGGTGEGGESNGLCFIFTSTLALRIGTLMQGQVSGTMSHQEDSVTCMFPQNAYM